MHILLKSLLVAVLAYICFAIIMSSSSSNSQESPNWDSVLARLPSTSERIPAFFFAHGCKLPKELFVSILVLIVNVA